MKTELGKELRKLRIDKDERILDMANKLGVSASFISAIETGKKSPPAGLEQQIAAKYDLTAHALETLARAADASRKAFTISPTTALGRDTAGLLARRMDTLSDTQLENIRKILLGIKDKK